VQRRLSATHLQAYARAVLANEARALQAKAKDSGRNWALFLAGAKLGKYVHHGVIALGEVEGTLLGACAANGLIQEDGLKACRATLASGLRKAANDALPTLGAYRRSA
jgi:hypothetical protein